MTDATLGQMKLMVDAIREDRNVGRGTCSTIDECMDDSEIMEDLARENITTCDGALVWAYNLEGLQMEKALNQSSGEPDCPLVEMYRGWNERVNS